jgi:uncharacterized protein with HEPN domain
MSPSLLDFLKHILHECDYIIEVTVKENREYVLENETQSKAIVRSLEFIGEATKKLPLHFRNQNPQIEWSEIAGMRDVLIHNYFGIDYDLVWNVVTKDIPELQHELQRIIDTESTKV